MSPRQRRPHRGAASKAPCCRPVRWLSRVEAATCALALLVPALLALSLGRGAVTTAPCAALLGAPTLLREAAASKGSGGGEANGTKDPRAREGVGGPEASRMKYPRAREGGGGPEANRTKDPRCNLYFHDSYYRFNATLGLCTDSRCTEPDYKFSIYMKKCMDRQATGRVDKLFGLMVDHGLDISRVTEKIWPLGTPFLDREGLLWHQALKEEGLDPRQISALGLVMPKYPRSWLPKFAALNRTKRFRYNWQGAGLNGSGGYRHRGLWMPAFAKAHFDARDFFRWTDPRNGYEQLGPYDHTGEQLPGGFILRKAEGNVLTFDEFYFATLAGSQFTVAPGGDGPCTLRFYEAIAAGSIPLVPKEDAPGVGCRHPYSYIPYKYATDANLFEYSEQIVQDNYRLLLKYQTFTEGDNVPPKAGSNW